MAATSLTRFLVFVSFIFHILQPAFLSGSFGEHSISLKYRIIILRRYMIYGHEIEWKATADLGRFFKFTLTKSGYFKLKWAVSKWTKHRQTSLVIPGRDPPLYITIYSDVAINPGPVGAHELLLRNR